MTTVDDIRARVDIVDLVGEHVQLKRAGRNFMGLCPFHAEKTPSFNVSPDRQTWHCFGGCATGGDVFSYVMRRESVDFPEALKMLAQRAGLPLPERRSRVQDERTTRLAAANEAAAGFFHETLLRAKGARIARDYVQDRGLNAEAIETFQIGYSFDSWEALKTHLTEHGFTEEELLAAGLITPGDRGTHDRFRGRLMFPIRDEYGTAIGFGGRMLENVNSVPSAKYINTAQTPMFDKGGILYALNIAKDLVRRDRAVVVVEGYMDVIAAHQYGMGNVVASMGTALTERQIRLLERLKCRVLLALDSDSAGIEATLRALQEAGTAGAARARADTAHPSGLSDEAFSARAKEWSRNALKRAAINFFVVPLLGKDPDEMIRNNRPAWESALANAKPFTDHLFDVAAERHDLSQPAERSALLGELLPVVRLIDEPVYRAHYIQRLARMTLLSEEQLRDQLQLKVAPRRAGQPGSVATTASVRREPLEEFCIAMLLRHPELRPDGMALPNEFFTLGEHQAIFAAWKATLQFGDILDNTADELRTALDRILQRELPFMDPTRQREAFLDCVRRIKLRRLSEAKQASTAALQEPALQPFMHAAVEEAALLQEAGGATSSEKSSDVAATNDLAASLLEDERLGRKLHQAAVGPRSAQRAEVSPQSEVER